MYRILCVDDDPKVISFVRTRLSAEADLIVGAVANDLETARQQLGRQPFDLVVLDYQLGVRTSVPLLASRGGGEPPVVVLTGVASDELVREVRALGAAGVVEKQRSHLDLIPAIRQAIRGETFFPGDYDANALDGLSQLGLSH